MIESPISHSVWCYSFFVLYISRERKESIALKFKNGLKKYDCFPKQKKGTETIYCTPFYVDIAYSSHFTVKYLTNTFVHRSDNYYDFHRDISYCKNDVHVQEEEFVCDAVFINTLNAYSQSDGVYLCYCAIFDLYMKYHVPILEGTRMCFSHGCVTLRWHVFRHPFYGIC